MFEKNKSTFQGIYRGKVLDNIDPDKYGRIKVQVYPVFASITDATALPWATPAQPIFDGAGTGKGAFIVPKIGSFVFVFFEAGDIYQPVYFAEAQDAIHGLPASRTTSYPNRKVWASDGIEIYIDDTTKEVKITHPTGTYVKMDNTKEIKIAQAGGAYIKIDAAGKITLYTPDDVLVESAKNITIKGVTVQINP